MSFLDRFKKFKNASKTTEERIQDLKQSKAFCVYPFVHLSTVPNGSSRPCCFYRSKLKKNDGSLFFVNKGDSLDEVWNSQNLKKIRNDMLDGKMNPHCQNCYDEEKVGSTSMRHRGLKEYLSKQSVCETILKIDKDRSAQAPRPLYLEVKPGNLCNLKCRMCGSEDSNQVEKELHELSEKYKAPQLKGLDRFWSDEKSMKWMMDEHVPSSTREWEESKEIWDEIIDILPDLEKLSIAGGEPSLLPGTHRMLEVAVGTRHSKHIEVMMASNFTHVPKSLLSVCTEFRMFEFIASIDGVGPVQEYIRFPSNWNEISDNFQKVKALMKKDRTKILVNTTIQVLNILNYTDVLDWLESQENDDIHFFHHPFNLNVLSFPNYLAIDILPVTARSKVIERTREYKQRSIFVKRFPELGERLDLICEMMSARLPEDYADRLKHFWHYTHIVDEHRGQSLAASVPELYHLVHQEIERLGLSKSNWLFYPLK